MEKENFYAALIGFAAGIIPKVLDWIRGRKNDDRSELEKVVDYLKQEIETLRKRLDEQSEKIEALHAENVELKVELATLQK